MHCSDIRNHASEFIDHWLDDEARNGVLDHLGACGECRDFVDGMRRTSHVLREIAAPAPPADLLESTLVALDREAEPEISIVTRRHFRLRPHYTGNVIEIARQIVLDYEFKLIAYSFGLVVSFCLFGALLASMRPILSLSPFVSPSQNAIWISPIESRVLGSSVGSVHSLPRIASAGAVPSASFEAPDAHNLVVIAEISTDGSGEIVEVLSHPSDAHAVGRLAIAMNQPSAFVPAYAASGRPISSRVVLFVESVEVWG
jgi:hypothetical protein